MQVTLWLALLIQAGLVLAGPVAVTSEDKQEDSKAPVVGDQMGPGEGVKDEEQINSELTKETQDRLGLYGGDIMLTKEQIKMIEEQRKHQEENGIEKRAVVRSGRDLWPNGVVPYAFSSSIRGKTRSAIVRAMNEYQQKTCLRFVPRSSQSDYIYFIRDHGCWSRVGRTGGRQPISIDRGCQARLITLHEISHALGRWHEQSRPDRDNYIRVHYNIIMNGTESNFEKLSFQEVTTNNIPYDYYSIMHYTPYLFSRNGQPTFTPTDNRIRLRDIGEGERGGFTDNDLRHIRTLYCSQQGNWSAWSQWSQCSRTCGGGTQARTRTCQNGNVCNGNNRETRSCNNAACPIWSPWSAWSSCTVSCGSGIQQRTRSCRRGSCVGPTRETRPCNGACWGPWTAWGSCSVTCGIGTHARTRQCIGGNSCSGNRRQTRDCNTNTVCPRWGSWSNWGPCSATCGTGQQERTRTCLGTGCSATDIDTDSRNCNTQPCPGVWTEWSDWGDCSEECGLGTQTRTRTCEGGVCDGDDTQERDCVEQPLCQTPQAPQQGRWSSWSAWSQCSASCNFRGMQFRTRQCTTAPQAPCQGPLKEVRKCNCMTCPSVLNNTQGVTEWGPWGPCTRTCGGGLQIRRRQCDRNSNIPCRGTKIHLRGCNYDNCPPKTTPAPPPLVVAPTFAPFTVGDSVHLSCKKVKINNGGIKELYTLNKVPFLSDIVDYCVDLAADSGFRYVGVAGSYCLSGSNTESHYTSQPDSTECENNEGAYTSSPPEVHMDVYRITPA